MFIELLLFANQAHVPPTPVELHPVQMSPGYIAPALTNDERATMARNAALIDRLRQATGHGAVRINALALAIEQARRARGLPEPTPPPAPPPPIYIERSAIAQQEADIADLRDTLVRQHDLLPRLERTLARLRQPRPGGGR